MYLPPHFDNKDHATASALIRANPLASLISNDDDGFPFVTYAPLHLSPNAQGDDKTTASSAPLSLWGHVARANPHWRFLQARPEMLVTFLGPDAYLSPSIYDDPAHVPSWNYVAVHCKVVASLIDEPEAKDRLLKMLITDHEPAYAAQWASLGTEFQHKMLKGIVGFELQVVDLKCKIKINQHRPQTLPKMRAQYVAGNAKEQALVGWIDKLT
jgi:transcriptional regulator